MSKVTVKYICSHENINVIHDWGHYVIAQLYSSVTDPNYVFTYLNFDQISADDEDDLIGKFYLNHDYIDRYNAGFIIGKIDENESDDEYKTLLIKIEAEETGTEGSKSFVVCLACGGEMGAPEYTYSDFQIIKASTKEEAVYKYNDINDCVYFKGRCIGTVVGRYNE